jgi:hypothetical protein
MYVKLLDIVVPNAILLRIWNKGNKSCLNDSPFFKGGQGGF